VLTSATGHCDQWEMQVQLYTYVTTPVDRGEWSHSPTSRCTPKHVRPLPFTCQAHLIRSLVGQDSQYGYRTENKYSFLAGTATTVTEPPTSPYGLYCWVSPDQPLEINGNEMEGTGS
jgi:hypothetical protein